MHWVLESNQVNRGMTDRFTPALNKVPGFLLKGITALANKPPTLQIFAPSKFGANWTTGSKVMAKMFIYDQSNMLAITFEPTVWLIPYCECEKIYKVGGLFAKAVETLSQ